MNQIYNFEQHKPPVLNENMLRAELERRRLRWKLFIWINCTCAEWKHVFCYNVCYRTLLLIAAAMLGFLVLEDYPWITALCLAYVLFSATGGSVLAVVVTKKGGVIHE